MMIMLLLRGDEMGLSVQRGKYRLQVSLTKEEYDLLRWFAYERNETVNVMLRRVALEVARDYRQNG